MDTQLKQEDPPSLLPEELEGLGAFNFGTEGNHVPTVTNNPDNKVCKTLSDIEEDHHIRLSEHAASLWKNNRMTDVVIKLRHVEYAAHKTVLSCYSKYFKDTLFKAEPSPAVITLKLDAVSNAAFSALLKYMYTGHLLVTVQTIGEIYTAARKLGMNDPINQCTKILTGKSRRNVHSVYVYVTAKRIGLEDAMKRALKNMCKRFEQIVGTQEFLDLAPNQVMEYLGSSKLATRSEVIVFLGALKWLSVDFLEREKYAQQVVECVRFPHMNMNEILACYNPPILPGIVESPNIKDILLKATCYVAAKSVNEEKRFQRYSCPERTYLIEREPLILWDPNIFDPERYALYTQEVAASKIQASFRAHLSRKDLEGMKKQGDGIQLNSQQQPKLNSARDDGTKSGNEMPKEGQRPDVNAVGNPLTDRIRRSVNSIFNYGAVLQNGIGGRPGETPGQCRASLKPPSPKKGKGVTMKNTDAYMLAMDPTRKSRCVTPKPRGACNGNGRKSRVSPDNTFPRQTLTGNGGPPPARYRRLRRKTSAEGSDDSSEPMQGFRTMKGKQRHPNILRNPGVVVLTGGFFVNHVEHPKSGNMLLLYDPASDKWNKLGEMAKPRHHHVSIHCNGVIYCIGGCDPRRTKLGEMRPNKEVYGLTLSSMMWKELCPMRHARMYHSVVELDGKVYVIGGQDDHEKILDSVEVYDPVEDEWFVVAERLDMPVMGTGACAYEGRIWIIGGMGPGVDGKMKAVSTVMCFDPAKEQFICDIVYLPYPRAFTAAVIYDNQVLVLGGTEPSAPEASKSGDNLNSTSSVLMYDTRTQEWHEFPQLLTARHYISSLSQGLTLLAFGGLTSFEKVALQDVLKFSDDVDEWVKCEPIPYPLCGFSSVWIPKVKDISQGGATPGRASLSQ